MRTPQEIDPNVGVAVNRSRGEGAYAGIGPVAAQIAEAWMKTAAMKNKETAGVVLIINGDTELRGSICDDPPDYKAFTEGRPPTHTMIGDDDFLIAGMQEDLDAKKLPAN